jgi:glyoxylase-like metal-dependent hydrolase (beta-lactamase superfamily II)/rhodanese-related sulfurtransferase
VIFKQFYLNCLAHASYLIGDETSGQAAVVDPQRDIDQYLDFAAAHHLRIAHVFLTHFHADFIAGHLELRDRTGATIYLGRTAEAEYAFTPVGDGSVVRLGDTVRIEAIETPGHTVESISLLIFDDGGPDTGRPAAPESATRSSKPVAVLTGDTLFVGDVGRPDLRASLGWSATELGGMLFDSLHRKLLALPDATRMYPAHGAGSLCGKALSTETVSTIGDQRLVNYALKPMSKQAFIDLVTADQPDAPAYFTYDAVLNSRERPTLDETLARELKPLSFEGLRHLVEAGIQLLDTRDPVEFAAAHLPKSINIGLGGQFATWAGTLLDASEPIMIVADPGAEQQSAMRLGRIGFDNIIGYLEGGLAAVPDPEIMENTTRLSPELAAERLGSATPPLALDVRTPGERSQKWIEGTTSRPLNLLRDGLAGVSHAQPVLVFCAGGYRSSIAASLLQRDGFTNVSEIAGGLAAWESAALPLSRGPASGSGQST